MFGADAGPELVACIQQIVADAMRSNRGRQLLQEPQRGFSSRWVSCVRLLLFVRLCESWLVVQDLAIIFAFLPPFLSLGITVPSLCSYPPFIVGRVCDPGTTCAEGGVTPSMCRGWSYPLHGQRGIFSQAQAPMCHCRPRVCW